MSIKDFLAPAAETFLGVRYGSAAKPHNLSQNKPQHRNSLRINLKQESFHLEVWAIYWTRLYFFLWIWCIDGVGHRDDFQSLPPSSRIAFSSRIWWSWPSGWLSKFQVPGELFLQEYDGVGHRDDFQICLQVPGVLFDGVGQPDVSESADLTSSLSLSIREFQISDKGWIRGERPAVCQFLRRHKFALSRVSLCLKQEQFPQSYHQIDCAQAGYFLSNVTSVIMNLQLLQL